MKPNMSGTLDMVNSPVFPVEKDLEIPDSAIPLNQTTSIQVYIQLAEPAVFLQGFEQRQWEERPPGLLRGSLILRVLKPSKIKLIELTFKGVSKTEWPEGIPPKRQEFLESLDIVSHTWPFFQLEHNNVANSSSTDPDDLLKGSAAAVYRPLKRKAESVSYFNLNPVASPNSSKTQGSNFLPIGGMLRKATSPDAHPNRQSRSNTNALSDLLTGTLSNNSDSASVFSKSSSSGNEPFIFQPGDYVYGFEQTIPLSCPESITASFGSVEYYLMASIERSGAFKSNIHARLPVSMIRSPSDSSVEETEPIAISRDWEDQLHYDIVIASKDIVLDAFLPIAFRITPINKVTLHRIRIYLTETMEYYCKNKKVHRLEPTKKFLLAEHKAPPLEDLPNGASAAKAKNLGNLLLDEYGDLVSKEFEYQVFIPERLNVQQRIHPDTSYQNIKANHWIKICLRLSRLIDGKRKHYEISIDSPIHVMNRLCSHANTLLPSYDTHALIPGTDCSKFGDLNVNLYHVSNLYFPKEVIRSPILSPEVQPLEERGGAFSPRSLSPIRHGSSGLSLHQKKHDEHQKTMNDFLLNSPELKSNLYQPGNLKPELTSPQAIPLSPISSPLARPIHLLRRPSFEPPPFDAEIAPPPHQSLSLDSTLHLDAPKDPPSYEEYLNAEGIAPNTKRPSFMVTGVDGVRLQHRLPKNNSGKSAESLENDIASSFAFSGSSPGSPDLPSSIFKEHSPKLKPLNLAISASRRGSIQDNLPSTVKNSSESYNDMNSIFNPPERTSERNTSRSQSSSVATSPRSSIDTNTDYMAREGTANNMASLMNYRTNQTTDTLLQSKDSFAGYDDSATDASVDITALYDRNSNSWHPLQNETAGSPHPIRDYSLGVADGNSVFEDFKTAFKIPAGSGTLRARRNPVQESNASSISAGSDTSPGNSTIMSSIDNRNSELP
ncbi:LANO_0F05578g1_1 [Lachancea nothofagi CBS 11611]|uniref:LANO_0F05578g1_1 n=1 Tax=Lachancea nothofagi CBS 11611 TaxID=1266666 RepID=A0A1G4K836_9SACH|nr:LANO_0F05578g1_1 [Lachancea nothofagi CBS 11611]